MAVFKFGDFEADIDASDYEFMRKYEEMVEKVHDSEKKSKKDGMYSEAIEEQCSIIFSFFDGIFGAGTAELMFGDTKKVRLCNEAIGIFNDAVFSDASALVDEINETVAKYSGNRAQRRKTKKTGGAK